MKSFTSGTWDISSLQPSPVCRGQFQVLVHMHMRTQAECQASGLVKHVGAKPVEGSAYRIQQSARLKCQASGFM